MKIYGKDGISNLSTVSKISHENEILVKGDRTPSESASATAP